MDINRERERIREAKLKAFQERENKRDRSASPSPSPIRDESPERKRQRRRSRSRSASSDEDRRERRRRSPEDRRDRRDREERGNRDRERDRDGDRRDRDRDRGRDRDDRRDDDKPRKPSKEESVEPKQAIAPPTKKALDTRSGGVYIPPYKLAQMQKDIADKSSNEYQKMTWEALKKSINGLVNKVSITNIKNIIPELFYENLIRGRGLYCRSIMKAQQASPNFTPVYAGLTSVVNTKMPEVGELLVKRLVIQFKKAFARNHKLVCIASTQFLAHLTNQQVVGIMIPLQICALLLEKPTDDSVEVAVSFLMEAGAVLSDLAPQGLYKIVANSLTFIKNCFYSNFYSFQPNFRPIPSHLA